MSSVFTLGLDIGSTTVKAVVLDGATTVFSDYRRHHADVRGEVRRLLTSIADALGPIRVRAAVTGSGGLQVAERMGVPFVQEVVAATEAIERRHPEADVVIELGGEDAKITFLKPVPEQRMNGTCAGGTGAFIDQMATLMHTDASGLDELASRYEHLYPIASRCGVFAKSDLQPLLNQGAAHTDLAASVFQAVATQTIAGLACGHPIRGNLVFLGGPLHFLPQLRAAYERALGDQVESFTTPPNAQLYVALGAAMLATGEAVELPRLTGALERTSTTVLPLASAAMRPLFADDAERRAFDERHAQHTVAQGDLASATGACFLGIDAGSTTIKAVILNADDEIVFSHYAKNEGDPVTAAVAIVRRIREALPDGAHLGRACVTGYGEKLIQTALRVDDGEIETMAHYRAAEHVSPGVTSVIDIGGQDMKYLRIRNGAVDSIAVNEACSAGCGSFLQTFAETMGTDVAHFAQVALEAERPVDLGSRCTVFMNSSVKQAQKEGAGVGDISAGLSYAVVRNALFKVIKLRDASALGDHVVVQGGTFLNDAVLRAFELLTKREVIRPNIAGLMGAYGAALTAHRNHHPGERTSLLGLDELDGFRIDTERRTCRLCQNHCGLTISHFPDGTQHVSGNRCERGASQEAKPKRSEIPNLMEYKYRRVFRYRRLTDGKAVRGEIGIPRALNMYENYPLWFTILTSLGFKVVLSGRSSHELFESGMESIPSENVCYPAKLAHGHIEWLLKKGITTIFYPCVSYEQREFEASDNNFNCPIVAFYPQVIDKNIDALRAPGVRFLDPFVNLDQPDKLAERLVETFEAWEIGLPEMREAVRLGYEEAARVKADVHAEGERALAYMREHSCKGIVLAGRPYHADPEINHGIPELINQLGMVVLTEDAVADAPRLERPLRVRDQWTYHSRLYEAAGRVRDEDDLQLVQLNSFGCGLDAVTSDQVQEILEAADDVYTSLKIDEVANLGAATIRLRSLKAAAEERRASSEIVTYDAPRRGSADDHPVFTADNRRHHTVYVPQMAPIHFRLLMPIFNRLGYRFELLEHASTEDVEVGLNYVNNDVCYPAIMVIGQLINAFVSGKADPNNSSVAITQTGGMCRATNYAGMLRKGLRDAGFGQVPVLAMSAQGLEESPGFKLTPGLLHRGFQALVIGDLLQNCLLRVRPYEAEPGSAQRLYERWDGLVREFFTTGGYSATLGRRIGYGWIVDHLVREFDDLPLTDAPRRPRVGLVGEILVKFQPDANNDAIKVVEDEGCEAVLPGLVEFFLQSLQSSGWKLKNLGLGSANGVRAQKVVLWLIEQYQKPAHRALARANGKFTVPVDIATMAQRAESIISLGTTAGEGWLLTAEMIELIETGTPNIICAQPFACLPNHVVGKGMFKELRRLYPQANVVSIDYDPGASEVNQLNRIKLMVATAHKNAAATPASARREDDKELAGLGR
ncbi:acyl-CoA dehydratase activase-related protein [Nigerium massiliense]|uniref:acyl-CoA dehydratase activase-related protein n=1 Tax=Nigerium massiliense TaxID=1522317 RepID=UPI0006935B1B|nr:acyl-CoA dehydratase activase-related protein [Nigerium massiliense]